VKNPRPVNDAAESRRHHHEQAGYSREQEYRRHGDLDRLRNG
jgi:hypothetical protein